MKKNILKLAIILIFLTCLLFLEIYFNISAYFSIKNIRSILVSSGIFAPFIYILLMSIAIIISPIPSIPLDIVAGLFFGPFLGTLYSLIGATIGAQVSFLISRTLGTQIVEKFIKGHINFCPSCSSKLLSKVVFITRLIPFFSFDIISYGAGLTKMTLRSFTISTFFGMIPLTFIYNYFGSVIIINKWLTLILAIVMVFLFFVLPWFIEKKNLFNMKSIFRHD